MLPGCRVTAGSLPGAGLVPGAGIVPGAAGCCRVLPGAAPGCEDVRRLPGVLGAAGLPGCQVKLPGSCRGWELGGGYQVGDSVKQRQVLGVLSRECRVRQACPVLVQVRTPGSNGPSHVFRTHPQNLILKVHFLA